MSFGHTTVTAADAPERLKQPVFVAAVVSDESSQALVAFAESIGLDAPIAAHHLTLGFIPKGGFVSDLVETATQVTASVDIYKLQLTATGVDTFGWNNSDAAVVDLSGDTDSLVALADEVKQAFGLKPRPLRPHLTLQYGVAAPDVAETVSVPVTFSDVSLMWGRTGDYTVLSL